jgi:flagellar motility protein MotE (MotC chaperone)
MADRIVYVSRLVRLPLLGADGTEVGRLTDVVLGSAAGDTAPQLIGFVVSLNRRRVFVGVGRVGELTPEGARLRQGTLNVRQFELRPGETLAVGQLVGRSVRGRRVVDLGLRPTQPAGWEIATVALTGGGLLGRRRTREVVEWTEAGELFASARSAGGRQAAAMGQLHPVEMAAALREMPVNQRRVLADALEDERLADLLEELSEEEQVRIVEGLDRDRVARVLDEMDADDAADLLGEMSGSRRAELLGAMDPEEAEPVRRLLTYLPDTAGGLMNPEPIILAPSVTVAEALARIRDHEVPVAMAAQVFVCRAPTETPTGRYLGVVGFQRLLREPPSKPLGRCLDDGVAPISADASDREVANRLAAYDAVALAVTDAGGRLVGAITVDDVLDHLLPRDWRIQYSEENEHGPSRPALDPARRPRGGSALRP